MTSRGERPPKGACTHWSDAEGYCGSTEDCREYIGGTRCPEHTPARLAGRPETVPDPTRTLDALRARAREERSR